MSEYYSVKTITEMSDQDLVALAKLYLPSGSEGEEVSRAELERYVIYNLKEDGRIDPVDVQWLEKPFIGEVFINEHGDPQATMNHALLDSVPGLSLFGGL